MQLQELSLRGNPLVVRFVKDMTYDPPSLLELAGRTIKSRNLTYSMQDLPSHLVTYLDLASKCPNPKCAGELPLGAPVPRGMQDFKEIALFQMLHTQKRLSCPVCLNVLNSIG